MNGLTALVPLAKLLTALTGSRAGETRCAFDFLSTGADALPKLQNDVAAAARCQLVRTGVISKAGVVDLSRDVELIEVCEILGASAVCPGAPPHDPRLVITAPVDTVPLRDEEKLGSLVPDLMRRATTLLHIGGAFWNDEGFEILDAVLLPALRVRHVPANFYVNEPDAEYRIQLGIRFRRLREAEPITVRWFTGAPPRCFKQSSLSCCLTSRACTLVSRRVSSSPPARASASSTFLDRLDATDLSSTFPPSETRVLAPHGRDAPDWTP